MFPIAHKLMYSTPYEVLSVLPLGSFLESLLCAFICDLRNSINQSRYIYIYIYIYVCVCVYL